MLFRFSLLSSVKAWWDCSETQEDTADIVFDTLMISVILPTIASVTYFGFLVVDQILYSDRRQVNWVNTYMVYIVPKRRRTTLTIPAFSHPRDHRNVPNRQDSSSVSAHASAHDDGDGFGFKRSGSPETFFVNTTCSGRICHEARWRRIPGGGK